jgi:hypothetical protein
LLDMAKRRPCVRPPHPCGPPLCSRSPFRGLVCQPHPCRPPLPRLHPDEYESPIDFGWAEAQGWGADEIAAAVGRTLDTPTYFMPPDETEMAEKVIDVSERGIRRGEGAKAGGSEGGREAMGEKEERGVRKLGRV